VAEDENYKKPVSPKRQSAVDLGKARPVVKATLGHFKKLETKTSLHLPSLSRIFFVF